MSPDLRILRSLGLLLIVALITPFYPSCSESSPDDLAPNRALWQQQGIASYSYNLQIFGIYSEYRHPVLIRVRAGQPASMESAAGIPLADQAAEAFGAANTVEKLFAMIETARKTGYHQAVVSCDPVRGFPVTIQLAQGVSPTGYETEYAVSAFSGCAGDLIQGSCGLAGRCVECVVDADCGAGGGACSPEGVCTAPSVCHFDTDCSLQDTVCIDGVCAGACADDAACMAGERCDGKKCYRARCSSDGACPDGWAPGEGSYLCTYPQPIGYSGTPLPVATAHPHLDCWDAPPMPPPIEVWAGAADAVVIGTVIEVTPLFEPAAVSGINPDPAYVSASDCTGTIDGGIQVRLGQVETLFGADLGHEVTLTLGIGVVSWYVPYLTVRPGQPPRWDAMGNQGRIEPGQILGGAIYMDPDWGFIGPQKGLGVFIQLAPNGRVLFQGFGNEDCFAPVPVGGAGLSLLELRERLAALDLSDPAIQAAIAERRKWYGEPIDRLWIYWGAVCDPAATCVADADCLPNNVCRSGLCGQKCVLDTDCFYNRTCVDGQCRNP